MWVGGVVVLVWGVGGGGGGSKLFVCFSNGSTINPNVKTKFFIFYQ